MEHLQEMQGGDITAQDMILPESEPSQIQRFYDGTNIFITGATGFLGKLLLEKLLRSCPGIQKIYVMMRPKKGKDVQTRLNDIFDSPVYDVLKRENSIRFNKVEIIEGDCEGENLGLSDESINLLKNNVNCIFHCAATVRFDEKLKRAAYINVRSTKHLLEIGKSCKKLKSFVYVSTAYSNCPLKEIDEHFYPHEIDGHSLLKLVDTLSDKYLDQITPTIIGEWPNTYVFTKSAAEDIVQKDGQNLPLAVVRPSIVIATSKEPVAGFIDNFYGPTGVVHGASIGLLRSLHAGPQKIADMVPADFVINTIIAAAWDIATIKSINDNKEKRPLKMDRDTKFEREIPIYNYVSCVDKPINWETYMKLAEKNCLEVKSPLQLWHYVFKLRENRMSHILAVFFLHFIPAYIVDFVAYCIGKKPILVNAYKKIDKFSDVISYFSTREWKFSNTNTKALWKKLNSQDQEKFDFDMESFNWPIYFYTYIRGGRVYLLKDPLDTVPAGERKYKILFVAHYTLMAVLLYLLYRICYFLLNLIIS